MSSGKPVVVGVAYKLVVEPSGSHLNVHFGWAIDLGDKGCLGMPHTWRCKLPVDIGYSRNRFTGSSVVGLMGGVERSWRREISEESERVLGDAVAYAVCEALRFLGLDGERWQKVGEGGANIFIFGFAIPKVVTRLYELCLPEKVNCFWICPVPVPDWITEGLDETALIPQSHLNATANDPEHRWDEEALIEGFRFDTGSNHTLLIQYLPLRRDRENIMKQIKDACQGKIFAPLLGDASVPWAIPAAAGQVDCQLQRPYDRSNPEVRTPNQQRFGKIYETGPNRADNREGIVYWIVNKIVNKHGDSHG